MNSPTPAGRYRFRDRLPQPGEGKRPRAEVTAKVTGTTARINLYDVIDSWGGYWGVSSEEFVTALDGLDDDVTEIRLHINSPGGEVYEAVAIANALRNHPARVVAVVDGLAASSASYIAVTADELIMGEDTEFMIHDPWSIAIGDAAYLREQADHLDRLGNTLATAYARKAGGDPEEWRAVMVAERWFTADETQASGLADRVGLVELDADEDEPEDDEAETAAALARSLYLVAPAAIATQTPSAAGAGNPPKEITMPPTATTTGEPTTSPAPAAPAAPSPVAGPTSVPAAAGGAAQMTVNEPLPYRFDGRRAAHGFAADLRARAEGDSEAANRLQRFMDTAFAAISTTDVDEHNPVETRPELYVPSLQHSRPLWNLVTTGTLDDITAFIIPKFNNAAGLVGPHTQGVEPSSGTFTATSQTVTPGAVSGKAEINREVIDQRGNPQVDAIIWNEMVSGYYEGIEQKIAAALAAVPTTETNLQTLTATADAALVEELKRSFSAFQFVKGGDRFTAFAAADDLYGALVTAADADGRPLLPIIGPTNSDGSVRASMESVQVGSKTITPAWALADDGAPKRSFLFNPSSVYAWASAPQRLDFSYQVKSVEVAIWGYSVAGVVRDSDVKPYDMTTVDA